MPQYSKRADPPVHQRPARHLARPTLGRGSKNIKSKEDKLSSTKESSPGNIEQIAETNNVINVKVSNSDENSSKNNKESGYISKEEKTTSSSVVVEKQSNPSKKGRKSKKIIYIIKDHRESPSLDACAIREAIQKNAGSCTCAKIH